MKIYLKLIIYLSSLVLIYSCTSSIDKEEKNKKPIHQDIKVIEMNKEFDKNFDKEFNKLAKSKFDLMNRADFMLNSKLGKLDNQLKTREDSKAYYIDGDFKGMTPKNIKFSVKDNHVSITMDLEKKAKNFSQTSSFTRMFPLSHPVNESQITTINKNGKLSITIPKI